MHNACNTNDNDLYRTKSGFSTNVFPFLLNNLFNVSSFRTNMCMSFIRLKEIFCSLRTGWAQSRQLLATATDEMHKLHYSAYAWVFFHFWWTSFCHSVVLCLMWTRVWCLLNIIWWGQQCTQLYWFHYPESLTPIHTWAHQARATHKKAGCVNDWPQRLWESELTCVLNNSVRKLPHRV